MFKIQTRNVPPFKLSKRFCHHLCRYGYLTCNHAMPDWMSRVELCYFLLTREGLANG